MLCLSDDDIIGYVMADKTDVETVKLIAVVNAHIAKCEKCAEKLELAEKLYGRMRKPKIYSEAFVKQLSFVNQCVFDDDDEM